MDSQKVASLVSNHVVRTQYQMLRVADKVAERERLNWEVGTMVSSTGLWGALPRVSGIKLHSWCHSSCAGLQRRDLPVTRENGNVAVEHTDLRKSGQGKGGWD